MVNTPQQGDNAPEKTPQQTQTSRDVVQTGDDVASAVKSTVDGRKTGVRFTDWASI